MLLHIIFLGLPLLSCIPSNLVLMNTRHILYLIIPGIHAHCSGVRSSPYLSPGQTLRLKLSPTKPKLRNCKDYKNDPSNVKCLIYINIWWPLGNPTNSGCCIICAWFSLVFIITNSCNSRALQIDT